MSNYMEEAFAPVEAYNRMIVEAQTWGHLAPQLRTAYRGSIVFAHSEYGETVPIKVDFPSLPDSPWFFDDMCEFIEEKAVEPGTVYRFSGTYTKFKNGSYRFRGPIYINHVDG